MIARSGRTALAAIVAAAATLSFSGLAQSNDWPSKPITMLIGYKAGGGTDTKGRVLAKILARELGQQVNVINRPGGGQAVALESFKNAKPNGDMFFFGAVSGITFNPQINSALKFTADDYVYAGGLTQFQVSLVAPTAAPFDDMAGFVKFAKKKGKIKYASLSPAAKVIMQAVAKQEGLNVDYIPTKGGRGMVQLVISGQVDFAYSGGIQSRYPDQIKTIVAVSTSRLGNYPDIPTLDELGYKGVGLDAPTVVAFPKGIDPAIVAKMEAALKVASTDPAMIKISKAIKMPIVYMTAAQAGKLTKSSSAAVAKMLKAIDYKAR
ncbi:MAG: tripartite tricarboxylate transporter substrate binding protein [Hyphomicrobiaceae bacterium]